MRDATFETSLVRRWARGYRALSAIVLNTIVVFLALNAVIFVAERAWKLSQRWRAPASEEPTGVPASARLKPSPRRSGYQLAFVDRRAFAGKDDAIVDAVLDDFFELGKRGLVFKSFAHFSEPRIEGKTLHVLTDERGFEYRSNGTPPPAADARPFRVLFLGGSTTFGYHAADDWTIPAYLELALREKIPGARVINHGHGYYYWFQELVLLEKLLAAGEKPDAVVFLDGVNLPTEGESPAFEGKLERMWDEAQYAGYDTLLPTWFPAFRLVNSLRKKHNDAVFAERYPAPTVGVPERVGTVVRSYLATIRAARAVAEAAGAKAYFFWQPHRFHECGWKDGIPGYYQRGVAILGGVAGTMEKWREPGYTYLGDLCRKLGVDEPRFVDQLHYGPRFSEQIAREIAGKLTGP